MHLLLRRSSVVSLTALALAISAASGCVDDPAEAVNEPPAVVDPEQPDEPEDPAPVDVFTVASLFPIEGPTSGFTQVEIHGQGLTDVVAVRFGETAALAAMVITDTLVVASTPPRPRGLVDVTVVRADGQSATLSASFRFESDIQISQIVPDDGHLYGGEPVTVRGHGFTHDTTLVFGERRALAVEYVDDTTMVAITPQSDRPGKVDVFAAGSQGVGTLSDGFEYFTAPQIMQVLPAAGPLETGTRVDIVGVGFTMPIAVSADGRPASSVIVSDSGLLSATFPPGDTPGPVDVVISTPYGTDVAAGGFTYIAADQGDDLALWAAHPGTGPIHGGTQVTLTVAGISHAVGATVMFGDQEATVLSVDPDHFSMQVATPEVTQAGAVDITMTLGEVTVTLPSGFIYLAAPEVHEVTPNYGSVQGGTAVTITGRGFASGAAARVGALAATQVEVIDDGTITAVTAAGSPGVANVTVLQNGVADTLYGGFLYKGELDIFVVSPSLGSQAGGTSVYIFGDGFGPDTQVSFGGALALQTQVLSTTKLLATTPPGELGAVEVSVSSGGRTASQPKGFTYYDPSSNPGTWGDPIDRNVNVTVVDAWTRQPVAGAAVILGDELGSPHQGLTDSNGQITFGGPGLQGEQTVTVTGSGYATAQVIGFDATNVALGVDPELTCSEIEELIPCDGPSGGQQASVEGEVKAPFKGTSNPIGDCDEETTAPGTLCLSCDADLDCGAGQVCTELQDQGSVCTSPCQTDGDCPSGYACLPIASADFSFQCVPSAGELRTYCDITEFGLGSEQAISWPGILVGPDGQFDMPSRLGDFAVYCWSGLYKDGAFTPQKLGVLRHQGAFEDGAVVQTTIEMNHPIDTPIEIVLDRPDIGPPAPHGEETVRVRIALDLGSDGVLDFPGLEVKNRDAITTVLPERLSGSLADAKWVVIATVTNEFVPNAYSTTWERGITAINSDRAYTLKDGVWSPATGSSAAIRGIASAGDSILGVGDGGQILRSFAEGHWALMQSGTKVDLNAVSTASDGTALVGGAEGTLLRFDGIVWAPEDSGVSTPIEGVLARAGDDYAVSGQDLLRHVGGAWSVEWSAQAPVRAIAAGAGEGIWVGGDGGLVRHHVDGAWHDVPTPSAADVNAILSTSAAEVWAVGSGGTIWRLFDGAFAAIDSPTTNSLNALWEGADGDLWVVGDRATILRRDSDGVWHNDTPKGYRSDFLAIGGVGGSAWAMGSHELVMGPMIAIPEEIRPGFGAAVGGPWSELTWEVRDVQPPHFNLVTLGGAIGPCTACGMTFMLPYDEWRTVANGSNNRVIFADLSHLTGKAYLNAGTKPVSITRVYMDSDTFDFNRAGGDEFGSNHLWKSWSGNETTIVR